VVRESQDVTCTITVRDASGPTTAYASDFGVAGIVGGTYKAGTLTAPNAPGPMAIPPPVQKQLKEELFRNLFSILLSDRVADRQVNAVAEGTIEITDKAGNAAKVTIDAATGLPAKLVYRAVGPAGPSDIENHYKDWREAGGVKFPYLVEIWQGGKKASEIKYETVTVNSGVKAEEILK
jgi:hypothetical protein